MNINKRGIIAVFLSVLVLFSAIVVYGETGITESGIYDPGNHLSEETRLYITNKNNSLYSKTGAKIIFCITNITGEDTLAEYANRMFATEGINNFGEKNSVLVVISPQGKDYWAKSAVSVSQSLNEELLGNYLTESFEPYFAEGNLNKGAVDLYDRIAGWYLQHYTLSALSTEVQNTDGTQSSEKSNSLLEIIEKILFIILLLLVFGAIILFIIRYLIKSEIKKRRSSVANIINHTNIDEIIEELPDTPRKSFNHEYEESVSNEFNSYNSDADTEPKGYTFSAGIDIEKEFAEIDIDDIINKNLNK